MVFWQIFFSEIQEASFKTCKGIGDNKAISMSKTCLEIVETSFSSQHKFLCNKMNRRVVLKNRQKGYGRPNDENASRKQRKTGRYAKPAQETRRYKRRKRRIDIFCVDFCVFKNSCLDKKPLQKNYFYLFRTRQTQILKTTRRGQR